MLLPSKIFSDLMGPRLNVKELEPFTSVIGTIKGRMKEALWLTRWDMLGSLMRLYFQCLPIDVVEFFFFFWDLGGAQVSEPLFGTYQTSGLSFDQVTAQVIPMLATAMRNLQQTEGYSEAAIVQWLDAFFLSRIGTVPESCR